MCRGGSRVLILFLRIKTLQPHKAGTFILTFEIIRLRILTPVDESFVGLETLMELEPTPVEFKVYLTAVSVLATMRKQVWFQLISLELICQKMKAQSC